MSGSLVDMNAGGLYCETAGAGFPLVLMSGGGVEFNRAVQEFLKK
jgi:hypothetical protein